MKPQRQEALLSLHGKEGGGFTQKDGRITKWESENPQPTEDEIDAEVIRLGGEYDAQEYARNRQAEFPSVKDLVVALYDTDDKADIEAKRAAVKAKYPKPE